MASSGDACIPVVLHETPVGSNESIYRRILKAWYHPGKTKRIPQRAFVPRPWVSEEKQGDSDGLSVNRACLVEAEEASKRPDNGDPQHLASFEASVAFDLGLSITPKESPIQQGESVIPEMNSIAMLDEAQAKQIDDWAVALRDAAVMVLEVQ